MGDRDQHHHQGDDHQGEERPASHHHRLGEAQLLHRRLRYRLAPTRHEIRAAGSAIRSLRPSIRNPPGARAAASLRCRWSRISARR